jgi:magnesium transporter
MLNIYPQSTGQKANQKPIWLDLYEPIPTEVGQVEKLAGITLPSREDLSEIERSSRLKARDGVLFMSVPMVIHDNGTAPVIAPIGFVLSRERLITIRFAALPSFDAVAESFTASGARPASGVEVFVDLCDEIVDRLADGLEAAAAELRALSESAFHVPDRRGRKAIRANSAIRGELRHVGRLGDNLSEKRDGLLALGRAIDFACGMTGDWTDEHLGSRINGLKLDVASLDNYEGHLSDKVQFLLDALVGLIGMAQNDIFRVLTVVSIVGIPPTLIAGIYGMNFKFMPELDWTFGYPYGLAMIVLSAILPLAWFKWRGWF